MTTPTVCRQCNADTEEVRLGRVEGEESGIKVAIEGLPTRVCTSGHKRFPTPEFPLQFIERVLASDDLIKVKPAVEKGFFRKKPHCPSCGEPLPQEGNGSSNGHARLELPDGEPATVDLAVPVFRCPKCNNEATLATEGVAKGIMQAVANAFRAADVPPG
jgi:transposase-like protein